MLFAVIFFWTPPHFWALAMKFRDDYAAASVPMLPVVASAGGGGAQDRPLLLRDGGGHAGAGPRTRAGSTAAARSGSAAWFLVEAHRLRGRIARRLTRRAPMRLFHLSIAYLTLLFAAVAVTAAAAVRAAGSSRLRV